MLPSEGRGHRFESYRVRQPNQWLKDFFHPEEKSGLHAGYFYSLKSPLYGSHCAVFNFTAAGPSPTFRDDFF
jgi:hypothetical protein